MKFVAVIGALAVAALAEPAQRLEERQTEGVDSMSVLQVLETALPPSLISLAITNSPAASSAIASEFAAGQTPSWFSALPSDVKTYLVPAAAAAPTSSGVVSAAATPRPSAGSSMPYGVNNTVPAGSPAGLMSATRSASLSATGSLTGSSTSTGTSGSGSTSSGSSGSSGSGSSSSGGAGPMPTAAFGAGLAGALGIVGLIAL